jgi:uncharacterized protein
MLISFSVENFRSFHAEETINLLASKRLGDCGPPNYYQVPGTDEHVLRVTSLYGANGAGKSNLVQALRVLERLVLHGTPRGERMPYRPFRLDGDSPAKPTVLDLRFVAENEVFRYGICYDAERVHEEWLDVYDGRKEHSLFARHDSGDNSVAIDLGTSEKVRRDIPTQIKSLAASGVRPNQPFLAEVVDRDEATQGVRFRRAINWFKFTLGIIEPDAQFRALANKIATDQSFAKFAGTFLREADTGIADIKVETRTIPRKELPPLSKEVEDAIDVLGGTTAIALGPDGEEVVLDGSQKDVVQFHKILAIHDAAKARSVELALSEESDGSRRLLNLLPALYRLGVGGRVFVIDEIERSMHPMLARKFIEFFLRVAGGAKSQLVFTTHESTLLDLGLMKRDGIWFAEKDKAGASHLYSLADFRVRKDLDIEKGYFAGRFGAVPFLGGIDQLMEQQDEAESKA